MKKIIQVLFALTLILSSCAEKEPTHTFYYADGSPISDTTDIRILSQEIDSFLLANQNSSLKIHSTLFPKSKLDCTSLVDSIRIKMRADLHKQHPEYKDEINVLSPESIYNTGIIVIENESGKVVNYRGYGDQKGSIFNWSIFNKTIYGLVLTMDKGFKADDDYVYRKESGFGYADGRKDTTTAESRNALKWLFSKWPYSTIVRYPHHDYTYAEWRNANVKMKFNLDFSQCSYKGDNLLLSSKLLDLTKTFAMINNYGTYKSTPFVDRLLNEDGKRIFTQLAYSKQLIADTIITEIKEILKYNMDEGRGSFVKEHLSLDDNHTVYFGHNWGNSDWLLCSNETYTIGIIVTRDLTIDLPEGETRRLSLGGWYFPKKCMPILEQVLEKLDKKIRNGKSFISLMKS